MYNKFHQLIGNTPIIDLSHHSNNNKVHILAKCEFMHPTLSIKDRIIHYILNKNINNGNLKKDMTVVSASSGNTGIAVAMFCSIYKYKCVITTSPKCSEEKQNMVKLYGAELIVSKSGLSESDPGHYMNLAKTYCEENDNCFDVNQYDNLDNQETYYNTLGPEIWNDTNGTVTHFICGSSTGGTLCGTSKYLKEKNNDIITVLVDPMGSILADYVNTGTSGKSHSFKVEGVGKGSITNNFDCNVVDKGIKVNDTEAFDTCKLLLRDDGLLVGGSSGLNVAGAIKLSNEIEEGIIVTVLPDSGVKYLKSIFGF